MPIWLLVVAALIFLPLFWKSMRSFERPKFVIRSPKLGIFNLRGSESSGEIAVDRSAISTFFVSVEESEQSVPRCDVLFMYCDLTPEGAVVGTKLSLREVIRDSGATIVVVASNNEGDRYVEAGKAADYGMANLAMTINRRGEAFPAFYKKLFEAMSQGVSMPVAWVKIAPQVPGVDHQDCPQGIFSCERGHVAFESPIGFAA